MGNKYEVVLRNKYFLGELIRSIRLEDSIDEISYRGTVDMQGTNELASIGIAPGNEIRISGIPYGGHNMVYLLQPGVIWECDSTAKSCTKHINVTIYDRTIYLEKSESEYLFTQGTTATQRLKKYCGDWGIKIYKAQDTGMRLSKAVYRARTIYDMIQADIQETAQKGGELYRPRMTPNGLELYELGSNPVVYELKSVEEANQIRTLEGTITRVKVMGKESEGKRTPILATVNGETGKYGTLQKVVSDSTITSAAQAKARAQKTLAGMQETFSVTGLDVNTIRAGDKVKFNGMYLIVISVKHDLGAPGHMSLELGSYEHIRRKYYAKSV